MKNNIFKNLILLSGLAAMTFLTSCGAECKDCLANGNPAVVDRGVVCPEEFATSEEFDTFITQYEISGGQCN